MSTLLILAFLTETAMRHPLKALLALSAIAAVFAACTQLTGGTTTTANGAVRVTTLTVPFNNSHLLQQGDAVLLIDSGGAEGAERLDTMIRAAGVDPAEIAAIIVTHGHHDHAGGALHFRETYGTPIIAGAGDLLMLQEGRNGRLCPTGRFANLRFETDQAGRYEGYTPDRALTAPLDLTPYGIDGRVIPVPGHTAGSLVVTAGTEAFVGDMFRGTLDPGGAEVHLYMCDLEDNAVDIDALLTRHAPNALTFHTGHFQAASRAGVEALANRLNGR